LSGDNMKIHEKPKTIDAIILSLFAIFITWHPYYIHGKINMHETGLYLPCIDAILRGLAPFRDFFYLRGAFELYMPTLLMKIFGTHINILYSYFYVGTVLTLILCVLIAKELYRTRYILYLMVPVVVARTFTRVVFTYWGGMRFAFGLMILYCFLKFLNTNKKRWIFSAGIFSGIGFFTSAEIGVCGLFGIITAFIFAFFLKTHRRKFLIESFALLCLGGLTIAVPYLLYLTFTNALVPYVDSVYSVVVNMQNVIDPHFVSTYPRNAIEAVAAMVNPVHKNFRHLTVGYLYLVLLAYLIIRIKGKKFEAKDLALVCFGTYGFIMYNAAFRGIWAAQFEMALQPEKIIFFFILENVYLSLRGKRKSLIASTPLPNKLMIHRGKLFVIYFLFLGLFMSSFNYSLMRYNRRFYMFKFLKNKILGKAVDTLHPLAKEEARPLTIDWVKGVMVPVKQGDER